MCDVYIRIHVWNILYFSLSPLVLVLTSEQEKCNNFGISDRATFSIWFEPNRMEGDSVRRRKSYMIHWSNSTISWADSVTFGFSLFNFYWMTVIYVDFFLYTIKRPSTSQRWNCQEDININRFFQLSHIIRGWYSRRALAQMPSSQRHTQHIGRHIHRNANILAAENSDNWRATWISTQTW